MCDKPTLYHSNNTGSKDQHKFNHKLIQCDGIHNRGGAHLHIQRTAWYSWEGIQSERDRSEGKNKLHALLFELHIVALKYDIWW